MASKKKLTNDTILSSDITLNRGELGYLRTECTNRFVLKTDAAENIRQYIIENKIGVEDYVEDVDTDSQIDAQIEKVLKLIFLE